jgi:3',5'-cyclic-AMP phosphodiesterase
MRIVQLTDLHITAEGTRKCGHIDTVAAFEASIDHVGRLSPAPDLILLTGDLADDALPDEYQALKSRLPDDGPPLAAVPGNHDDRAELRALMNDWRFQPEEGPFLQSVIDLGPSAPVLLLLDTVIPGDIDGMLCPERLNWLERALSAHQGRPVLIVMHHPLFLPEEAAKPRPAEELKQFERQLRRHGHCQGIISGHRHRAIATEFAGAMAWVSPATSFRFPLPTTEAGLQKMATEPPMYTVHDWSPNHSMRARVMVV